jgi:ATP-binding cassette subfamily B protein
MPMSLLTAKIPQHIRDVYEKKSINIDNLIACEYSDMSKNGEFADVWLAFDKEYLYIMKGYDKVVKKKGNQRLKVIYELISFDLIPLEKIKKLEIERFISTARLVSYDTNESTGDVTTEIVCFSLGAANKVEKQVRRFNTFKEGKPIEEDNNQEEEIFCPKCGSPYPDTNRKVCPKCMDKRSITKRLLGFFKYYYKNIFIFFALMLINTVFTVISPYIGTKMLYDDVLTEGGSWYGEVTLVLLMIIGIRIISLILNMTQGYISASVVPFVIYDIKLKIFTSMQRLSVSFYTSKQTGSLMSRVNGDAQNIYWFFVDGCPYLIVNVITFIGVLIIMFMMNWQLSVIITIIIPLIITMYKIMWRLFRRMYHAMWVHGSNMTSHISDSMSGQRVIKAFAKEKEESSRFSVFSSRVRNSTLRTANAENTAFPMIGLLTIIANLIVLGVGGIMIVQGTNDMTLGKLMTFTSYMNMLYGPLDFLSSSFVRS